MNFKNKMHRKMTYFVNLSQQNWLNAQIIKGDLFTLYLSKIKIYRGE